MTHHSTSRSPDLPISRVERSPDSIVHALSFDIEDWFHMVEIDAVSDPAKWDSLPSIVVDRTRWIVDLVGEYGYRATFFILGWVAERYPEVAKGIAKAGHEVGTHSYWHRKVYDLSPEEFREDVERSIRVLEDQTSAPVRGFRAPSFSITPGAEWALDVLLDCGITYDASLFPASRGHGGYPCPQQAHLARSAQGREIPELPMSVARWGSAPVPFSGGGYMRFLPRMMIERGFRSFERRGIPAVIYLHPRDFDPDCPRVPMPLKRRFKCYVGLKTTEGKLRTLLASHRFDTCARVLEQQGTPPLDPPESNADDASAPRANVPMSPRQAPAP